MWGGLDVGSQQAKEAADYGWKEAMIRCIRVAPGRQAHTRCIGGFRGTAAAPSALVGRKGRSYLVDPATSHMLGVVSMDYS